MSTGTSTQSEAVISDLDDPTLALLAEGLDQADAWELVKLLLIARKTDRLALAEKDELLEAARCRTTEAEALVETYKQQAAHTASPRWDTWNTVSEGLRVVCRLANTANLPISISSVSSTGLNAIIGSVTIWFRFESTEQRMQVTIYTNSMEESGHVTTAANRVHDEHYTFSNAQFEGLAKLLVELQPTPVKSDAKQGE